MRSRGQLVCKNGSYEDVGRFERGHPRWFLGDAVFIPWNVKILVRLVFLQLGHEKKQFEWNSAQSGMQRESQQSMQLEFREVSLKEASFTRVTCFVRVRFICPCLNGHSKNQDISLEFKVRSNFSLL